MHYVSKHNYGYFYKIMKILKISQGASVIQSVQSVNFCLLTKNAKIVTNFSTI